MGQIPTALPQAQLPYAQIAKRAYDIYLSEGMPPNRQEAHWLQAEAELRSRSAGSGNGASQHGSPAVSAPGSGAKAGKPRRK